MRGTVRRLAMAAALPLALLWVALPGAAIAQEGAEASIRVIHGAAAAGPVDLYLDGALAVVGATFLSVTDPLIVEGGEHRVTVTPSGAGPDAALVDVSVAVEAGTSDEILVAGAPDSLQAVLFPIDDSPLEADFARVRIVHASPDAGPVDPVVIGGDQLFPTVDYLQATEYAEVPPGLYPLAALYAGSDVIAVDMPDIALDAGTVTDLYVVGQVTDGTAQPVAVRSQAAVAPRAGGFAAVRLGDCRNPGEVVAELGVAAMPRGDVLGAAGTDPVGSLFATAPVLFDDLLAAPHALTIAESEAARNEIAGCGEIGGALDDSGALTIPLSDGGDLLGIAVISPGVLDPAQTDVSVFAVLPAATDGGAGTVPADATPSVSGG